MAADRDTPPFEDPRTSVERLVARSREGEEHSGRPLSRRTRQTRRSVESYLEAGVLPRWMERLGQIDRGTAREKRRLERAYRSLAQECGAHPTEFARRWRGIAERWPFEAHNDLVREHNEWYPIERDLPMDPRTRDYVLIRGRSYTRPELGPAWVLEHFPADLEAAAA
jgi:hypothetical protein